MHGTQKMLTTECLNYQCKNFGKRGEFEGNCSKETYQQTQYKLTLLRCMVHVKWIQVEFVQTYTPYVQPLYKASGELWWYVWYDVQKPSSGHETNRKRLRNISQLLGLGRMKTSGRRVIPNFQTLIPSHSPFYSDTVLISVVLIANQIGAWCFLYDKLTRKLCTGKSWQSNLIWSQYCTSCNSTSIHARTVGWVAQIWSYFSAYMVNFIWMSENKKGKGMCLSVLNDYVSSLSATYTTVGQLCQTVCLPEGVFVCCRIVRQAGLISRVHVGWDSVHQSVRHTG